MPGLLGEQLFKALDRDEDGALDFSEFVSGFLRLYSGSTGEVSQLLFRILDFGHKGYVTRSDMHCALAYLPTQCIRCGTRVINKEILKELVAGCFTNQNILPAEVSETLFSRHKAVFRDFLAALLTSLPIALDEAVAAHCVHRNNSDELEDARAAGLKALRWKARRYFVDLGAMCLYIYRGYDRKLGKKIVWLGDLFVSPVEDSGFELKNRTVSYLFQAESREERDEWVERIQTEKGFRWFDDYYITDKIKGLGAYGHVVKAYSRISGKEVAVKIVDKSALSLEEEEHLCREISILRFVSHPNLLQLYDVFETFERIYIVTELIEGGTLFEYLEEQKFSVSEEFSKKVVSDIAHGLAYLHSNGIVHRDLKLENVLLRHRGEKSPQCVLIDFGLSRFLGPTDMSDEAVGTLQYAAPEVVSKQKYRTKVDSWSLGVVLYILLTGEFPFDATTDHSLILRILGCRLHFSGKKWTSVTPQATAVASALLKTEVNERWSINKVLQSDWLFGDLEAPEACEEGTIQLPFRKRVVPSPDGRRCVTQS